MSHFRRGELNIELRADIAFINVIKAQLAKTSGSQRSPDQLDRAVRQLVSKAIMADKGIIDVFSAAGLKKPDENSLKLGRRLKAKFQAA